MLVGCAKVLAQEQNPDLQVLTPKKTGYQKVGMFIKHNSLITTQILDLGMLVSKKALTPKNS